MYVDSSCKDAGPQCCNKQSQAELQVSETTQEGIGNTSKGQEMSRGSRDEQNTT